MIDDVNDIFTLASDILEELNIVYTEHTGDVTPLPTRQYIDVGKPGDTPHDCEQVTVTFNTFYVGMPGQPAQNPSTCDSPLSAAFYVEVVREILSTKQVSRRGAAAPIIPTAAHETEMSRIQMQDARLMMEAGLRASSVFIGGLADVSSGTPNGGYQAMVMTLVAPITGGTDTGGF